MGHSADNREQYITELEGLLRERTDALREAIEALKTSERERSDIIAHDPSAFLSLDHDMRVLSCNGAAEHLFGVDREVLVGRRLWASKGKEESDGVFRKKYLEALAEGRPISFRAFSPVVRKWLEVNAYPSCGRLLVYLRDVSTEKRYEELSARFWRDYRSLADNAPDLILRFDEGLRCTFGNRAFQRLVAGSRNFLGKTHGEMGLPEKTAGRLEEATRKVFRTRAVVSVDFEIPTREGMRFLSWRAAPELGPDARVASVLVIARDVTRQREEEQTRIKLAAAIEAAQEGVALAGPDGILTYINSTFSAITGFEKAKLVGQPLPALSGQAADPSKTRSVSRTVRAGRPWSGRFTARRNGGGEFLCDLRITPLKDDSGAVTSFIGLLRDVTREASLEEQVRESQKLEALGTLSGGIAHDFNNLLAVILGNTELALDDMPENDLAVRNLRQVHTAALRGRDLVKQILAFSRKSAPQAKPFSVTPLIRETTKLLRSTVPTTIEIREDLKAAEDTLNADPTQIQQVILNLTTNAAHAMAEGGVMTIGLDRITLDSTGPLPDPGLRPGDYLVLSVADTGTGMDETVRRKIFEPFFTTKEAGRGTGLGLSVAYGIVKAHEGAITVETAKGNGTLFRVFLPKAQGMAAADEAPRRRALQRGSASILFIDDEEAVASMAQESLSRLGYKIQAETDPEAALKEFSRDATRFDLVITDQAMPRMSGLTLAQRVLEMRPDIPVILCTGYSETVDEKTAKEAGIGAFLMKPVTREQMANAVKRALARQQGG